MTARDLPPALDRLPAALIFFAALFVFAGMTAVDATAGAGAQVWPSFAIWLGCLLSSALILRRYLPSHDPLLFCLAMFLSGWGLVAIQRLAPPFADRQAIWLVISVAAMLAAAVSPRLLRWLRVYRLAVLAGGLLLLLASIAFGSNPSGVAWAPRLWLGIGAFTLQPSEFMKIILVSIMASYLAGARAGGGGLLRADMPRLAGPMLLMWLLSLVILVWQRDLGAAMLFFVVFLLLLYLTSGDLRLLLGGVALVIVAAAAAYQIFDVVKLRVDIWLNPWPEADGRAYQIVQSLMAFGAGGVFGRGVGLGSAGFIPVAHSDFVFAALAEEWGLLGVIAVLSCFAVFALRGLSIGLSRSRGAFSRLLAAALTMMLVTQALMIMAGVLKLLPLTGVTLPFVSYGGSSLLVCFTMVGLLLRLSVPARSPPHPGARKPSLSRGVHHLLLGSLACLLAVALAAAYWALAGPASLLQRDDNPRRHEALAAIRRGSIYDRNGRLLVETVASGNALERRYLRPSAYSAVGYFSLRYGSSGAEAAFDAHLSGASEVLTAQDFIDRRVLGLPQTGADIRLTIDADLQDELAAAIGEARGAALALDAKAGDILALVSRPSYDPNTLDDDWPALIEAPGQPFFNRALQGQYQLGGAMYTVLMARAIASDFDLDRVFADADAPIAFADGLTISCVVAPGRSALTLLEAYAHGCPAPFSAYFRAEPAIDLDALLGRFAFDAPIALAGFPQPAPIDLPAAASALPLDDDALEIRAALGQGDLTATPLRMAAIMAAIATDGSAPAPFIHAATRAPDAEQWRAPSAAATALAILREDEARQLRSVMREAWTILQGDSRMGASEVGAQLASSQAGEDEQIWLNGFVASAEGKTYAFVILLEGGGEPSQLLAAGQTLARALELLS